jgi:hypothetical protein
LRAAVAGNLDRRRRGRGLAGVRAPVLLAAASALVPAGEARAWGLVAHRIVTEAAAEKVPPDAAPFFRRSASRLSDLSLEPDTVLRARDPDREDRRHFINLDALEPAYPAEDVPHGYEEAAGRYGEARLRREGILPWRIASVLDDLRAAMRRRDAAEVLRQAGYLSHYVADAHQPLHLTRNHDGQLTCNAEIHHAFESEMIERGAAAYRAALRASRAPAAAVDRPLATVFRWMRESYADVARILEADTAALRALKGEGKDYYAELQRLAGPVAERRLAAAAAAVASLWYTAWVDAGRPELPPP